MTTERKKALKAFIIKWELLYHGVIALAYLIATVVTIIALPNPSPTFIAVLLLVTGILTGLAGMAAAIKSDDTLK